MPTRIMGVLDIISGVQNGRKKSSSTDDAIQRGKQLIDDGADLLTIECFSSRAGIATSDKEELQRIIPVIQTLHKTTEHPIAIDTYTTPIAAAAIEAGASFIHDMNSFRDEAMQQLVVKADVDICLTYRPEGRQSTPHYADGIVKHLLKWFEQHLDVLLQKGIKKKHITLGLEIGNGKSVADNLEIMQNLGKFKALGFPLLVGISRQSFISKVLNKPASDLFPATIAANTVAMVARADIVRVHDVVSHREVVELLEKIIKT